MSYKITVPPVLEPVTLAEVKQHLRVEHSEEDTLISTYIKAARVYVEKYTNRLLMPCTVQEYFYKKIPCKIELRWSPVREISFVKYLPADVLLDEATIANTEYFTNLNDEPATIVPKTVWPSVRDTYQVAHVQYQAGYVDAASVPANIKMAILLIIGELYETRENTVKKLPTAADHLLRMEKIYL